MSDNPAETDAEAVVRNPADGNILSRHSWMDAATIDGAFSAARSAQPAWARLSHRERARRIALLANWFEANADRLAGIISRCTGKPLQDAIATEVLPGAGAIAHYARQAPRWLRAERPKRSNLAYLNKRTEIHHVPHGLVGIISPWNYPLGIPTHEITAALLAGNAVVFKTAPETIPVGEALAEGIASLALPEGLFHHLIMPGPAAGERLLRARDGVDKLSFTGSVAVGRLLAERAARHFIPVTLELGGKDAMLIAADAPLERTVNGALWGGLQNTGQACAGIERIYVERPLYDRFVERLTGAVESIRVGLPESPDTDLGPLATARQRDKVAAQVNDACEDGARILARSPLPATLPEGGYWYPATLMGDLRDDMAIMREESFGPILAVQPVETLDEAVARANDSPFALTASVWTGNRHRGRQIATQLRAGTVTVNDHLMTHGMPEVSWGGPGESGLGRSHGRSGLLAMTREHNIVDERLTFATRAPWWFPYSNLSRRGLQGILTAFHGRGALRRAAGLRRFVRLIPGLFRRT